MSDVSLTSAARVRTMPRTCSSPALLTSSIADVVFSIWQVYARFNRRYTSNSLTASAAASVIAEECFGSIRTVCLQSH